MDSLLGKVWEGRDMADSETEVLDNAWGGHSSSLHIAKYVILGPFDSGTNLFVKTVKLNFRTLAAMNFPSESKPGPWKHTLAGVEAIEKYIKHHQHQSVNETVAVMMLRSPIATLAAWKKAPYDIKMCMSRPWALMDHRCVGYLKCLHGAHNDAPGCSMEFNSTMEVYNSYVEQYMDLQATGHFKEVMVVLYEDLVSSPEKVMQRFGNATGQVTPMPVKLLELPAKRHGQPVGREAALIKIKEEPWLESISEDELRLLCAGIDWEQLERLKEHFVVGAHVSSMGCKK